MLTVHGINDRGRAADGFVAEKYRKAGLQIPDPVVIDDLKDICLIQAFYRLRLFVMIDKDEFLSVQVQEEL